MQAVERLPGAELWPPWQELAQRLAQRLWLPARAAAARPAQRGFDRVPLPAAAGAHGGGRCALQEQGGAGVRRGKVCARLCFLRCYFRFANVLSAIRAQFVPQSNEQFTLGGLR